jgi:hypothetical protein
VGPDFQWRPTDSDAVTGQLLVSDTRTPERPDIAGEWDGRDLTSHALYLAWQRNERTYDWFFEYKDVGDDFRADSGFLPQVGVRDAFASFGRLFYPETGLFRRVRPFLRLRNVTDAGGDLVLRRKIPGIQLEGFWSSFVQVEQRFEEVRVGDRQLTYDYTVYNLDFSPTKWLGSVHLDGQFGDDVDFDNARPGRGVSINLSATLRPTDHLELRVNGSRRWLDVAGTGGGAKDDRLFTAEVARLRATYTFTSRMFVRAIGQQVRLELDPDLYTFRVEPRAESFTGSVLFAYKLNWQTVLFVGYGDERALNERTDALERAGRELFLKVSYAFQR